MRRLTASAEDFEKQFARIVNDRRESDTDVANDVRSIIGQVRQKGDDALIDLSMRFDKHALTADLSSWRVGKDQCKAAFEMLLPDVRKALTVAAERIRAYHEGQLPQNRDYRDEANVRLGARWGAVDAAGL